MSTQDLADSLETEGHKILEASARLGDLSDAERTLNEVKSDLSHAQRDLNSVLDLLDSHTERYNKTVDEATSNADAITLEAAEVANRMIQEITDGATKMASKARAAAEQDEQDSVNQALEARKELVDLEASLRKLSEVSENTRQEIAERQTALDSLNEQLRAVREEFKNLS